MILRYDLIKNFNPNKEKNIFDFYEKDKDFYRDMPVLRQWENGIIFIDFET